MLKGVGGVYELVVGKQPTVGAGYALERNTQGLVNRYGTHVGRDLSPPPPIYRPVSNPSHGWMKVLKLMISPRLLDDHSETGRSIGGGRGKPAPTVGCLPTPISYTPWE